MLRKNNWIALISAALIVVISGCTTQRTPTSLPIKYPSWQKRKSIVKNTPHWRAYGSASVQYKNGDKIDSQFLHFDWVQNKQKFDIQMSGPFYLGHAALIGSPGQVTLKQGDEKSKASSPESLLKQKLGWYLPVSGLTSWIRGIPRPGSTSSTLIDKQHRLSRLTQNGWYIVYQSYQPGFNNNLDLPKRIQLANGPLKVTIVVRQWSAK